MPDPAGDERQWSQWNHQPEVERKIFFDQIWNSLDEQEQALLDYRFFQEKSYIEIGAILGISADAAESMLRRLLGNLKKKFDPDCDGSGPVRATD